MWFLDKMWIFAPMWLDKEYSTRWSRYGVRIGRFPGNITCIQGRSYFWQLEIEGPCKWSFHHLRIHSHHTKIHRFFWLFDNYSAMVWIRPHNICHVPNVCPEYPQQYYVRSHCLRPDTTDLICLCYSMDKFLQFQGIQNNWLRRVSDIL